MLKIRSNKTQFTEKEISKIKTELIDIRNFLDNWFLPESDMKDAKSMAKRIDKIIKSLMEEKLV